MDDSLYYQHAGKMRIAQRVSHRSRQMIMRLFYSRLAPGPETTVLDVGVSLDVTNFESNLLEQVYAHRHNLTCVGIGKGQAFTDTYHGVNFVQIEPHQKLPFADGSFDIVYSNAVVEHVGSEAQQRAFVHELCRVGKNVFVVTPNRLFPIEHHTCLPFVHYAPLKLLRTVLRKTRYDFWSDEKNLNPLFLGQLKNLFPPAKRVEAEACGIGFGPWRSNLVAIT